SGRHLIQTTIGLREGLNDLARSRSFRIQTMDEKKNKLEALTAISSKVQHEVPNETKNSCPACAVFMRRKRCSCTRRHHPFRMPPLSAAPGAHASPAAAGAQHQVCEDHDTHRRPG